MTLDNSFADSQAHTEAGVLIPCMQTLENIEDSFVILRVDSDTVVADGKEPRVFLPFAANVNFRPFVGSELDGVLD